MADLRNSRIPTFELRDNTLVREVKSDPDRKITVEMGDLTRPDYVPQTKTKHFDNEYNVSVRAKEHPDAVVRVREGKVYYETPDYTVIQYEKPDAGEEGGHELEWELPAGSTLNVLPFTLRYKGNVRFYYQGELTPEEIEQGARRPENVIGSYAVYIDKANNKLVEITREEYSDEELNEMIASGRITERTLPDGTPKYYKATYHYNTGKIEHIYRPKAWDEAGNETWCELHIPENGEAETNIDCHVEIPAEWLANAVGKVTIDPTFGYTSVGTTGTPLVDHGGGFNATMHGTLFSSTENLVLQSVSVYLANTSLASAAGYALALYQDSDDSLLEFSEPEELSSSFSSGWFSKPFGSFVTAQDYILAGRGDRLGDSSGGKLDMRYDSVSSVRYFSGAAAIRNGFPSPFSGTKNTADFLFSIYATYSDPTLVDPTPTLEFTGTDPDSDDVTYQVQISEDFFGGADPDAIALSDDFDDNSLDTTTRWDNWGGSNVQETNQRIEITGSTGVGYYGFESKTTYDLTGKHAFVELGNVQNPASGWSATPIQLTPSSGNNIYWMLVNGSLQCWTSVSSTYTQRGSSITYDPDVHKFVRIRESGGTTYFDWSTDGRNWTNHTSTSNPFAVTTLRVVIMIGTDSTVGSTPSFTIDNFNIIPPATPTVDALSATDAGFENLITPADTDPFTSGERMAFTVQSGDALDEGTYYWRVRAKDPGGSNAWGPWSNVRVFEVEAPSGSTVDETISGVSRIAKTVDQTIAGIARIAATADQTIAGAARIRTTVDTTIDGTARLTATVDRTIAGTANIANTTDRTISGAARIAVTTDRDIEGVAKIVGDYEETLQTITGVANIKATTDREIDGRSRIEATADQTIEGRATLNIEQLHTIDGLARMTAEAEQDIPGHSRVAVVVDATLDGTARVTQTTDTTIPGTARVEATTDADIEGAARITQTTTGRIHIKTLGAFLPATSNIKIGGAFVGTTSKVKVDGTFI